MNNLPWFAVVLGSGAILTWGLVTGIREWRHLGGKIVAVTSGLLLTALLAFVALVALIVASGQAGHPF